MKWKLLALLGLGGTALVVLGGASRPAPQVFASGWTDSFVTRNGTQLLLGGQPFRFTGLNIYNANSNGWCWYAMHGSTLDNALSAIGPGKTVVRAWFHQPLAMDANGQRDWSAFDHTLAVARTHGVKVIVTMSDQWGECGDGGQGGAVPGANGFKPRSWYIAGYTQPDPGLLVSYRDWVQEVVTRYKDDATVLAWQLMNEAEIQEYWGAGCPVGDEAQVLKDWAAVISSLIKSIDPVHLVSLGTIGGGQCGAQYTQYQFVHDLPTIDLCEYHDYTPNVPMPGDQWNGLQFRINQCNALNKPIFVGEVGIRPSDVAGGTLADRAAALDAKLRAQSAAGVAGFLGWAWSNLGSTLNNYDIGPGDPVLDVLARYADGDGDGCADARELGGEPQQGGGRSPKTFWDVYDVWTRPMGNPTGWERNRVINLFDILGVAARFGASGTPPSGNAQMVAAALTPPGPTDTMGYHVDFDRGSQNGPNLWNRNPPDGVINIADDILGAASQFGVNCT